MEKDTWLSILGTFERASIKCFEVGTKKSIIDWFYKIAFVNQVLITICLIYARKTRTKEKRRTLNKKKGLTCIRRVNKGSI